MEKAIYIGNTYQDYMAATEIEIPFVFAKYGFGNVTNSKYVISNIVNLIDFVETFWKTTSPLEKKSNIHYLL